MQDTPQAIPAQFDDNVSAMNASEASLTFDFRDEYLRQPIAEKIITLLASDARVSPLVIDGGWGTGKTEFCQKLIALAIRDEAASFTPVYVDAFRADHADQPLMTLLAAVIQLAPEKNQPTLKQKAIPALRFGVKVFGKAGVKWLLKQDADELGEELQEAMQDAGESAINAVVEAMLEDHIQANANLKALQEVLAEVAREKPIVLFIDELDRCRPDFAVAMLEVIKHAFDVIGVKIVLVTNTQQLKAAINHRYGNEVDAQRYLDKFIGFTFKLPATFKHPLGYQPTLAAKAHFQLCVAKSNVLSNTFLYNEEGHALVDELIEFRNMSLREIETWVKCFEVYQSLAKGALNKEVSLGYQLLRIYAIYCHCFYPPLVESLLSGKRLPTAIADSLGKSHLVILDEKYEYNWPVDTDLLLAMLVYDSKSVEVIFEYNEQQAGRWFSLFNKLFGIGGLGVRDLEGRLGVLVSAFRTLQFQDA